MYIDKVSYQKTFNLGNYQSEKIEICLVLNEGEDATKALDTARQLVEEYHKEINPPPPPVVPIPKQSVVQPNGQSKIDKEWNEVKAKLAEINHKEDAQAYIDTTSFKLSIEAKKIINTKPSKK